MSMNRPASASRKGRAASASSASPSVTSEADPPSSLGGIGGMSSPPKPTMVSPDPDLEYAKTVERQLNRAMSTRTRTRIESQDARMARKIQAQLGGTAAAPPGGSTFGPGHDSDTHDGVDDDDDNVLIADHDEVVDDDEDPLSLDPDDEVDASELTDPAVNRPITAHTKQQLDDDESVARQMQIEMLYDLHGSSSKQKSGNVGPNGLGGPGGLSPGLQAGSSSPPAVQGSAGSLLKEGNAHDDLSVTGKGLFGSSTAGSNFGGTTSPMPSSLAGAQRVGLGNEFPSNSANMNMGLTTSGGAGGGGPGATSLMASSVSARGGPSLGSSMNGGGGLRRSPVRDLDDDEQPSEYSHLDSEREHNMMLSGEASPSPEPPLSSSDLDSLFAYITQFKPEQIDLEPALKPFLPDYIPAIGDLEAMIKIPPPGPPSIASTTTIPRPGPDGTPAIAPATDLSFYHDLGITLLDEPAAKQSDPAVLHYQLKALAKTAGGGSGSGGGASGSVGTRDIAEVDALSGTGLVHAIDPEETPGKLDDWIASTASADWAATRTAAAPVARGKFPPIEKLMQAWDVDESGDRAASPSSAPLAFTTEHVDALTRIVDPDLGLGAIGLLDVPLADAMRLACAVFQIPVYETIPASAGRNAGNKSSPAPSMSRGLIDAAHCLVEVYAGFAASQHFNNPNAGPCGNSGNGSGSNFSMDMTGLEREPGYGAEW
ncbi:hypothetical protein BC828DRAFT_377439 [Blastocladiella britannica]|nr:hypothetical protein BC828DRAFT_377439 [Blastocladiella britannica]